MTQVNMEITLPEPQGTSQISFHAVGSLEEWDFMPLSSWNERQIEIAQESEEFHLNGITMPMKQ
jgi:hypothetical protein